MVVSLCGCFWVLLGWFWTTLTHPLSLPCPKPSLSPFPILFVRTTTKTIETFTDRGNKLHIRAREVRRSSTIPISGKDTFVFTSNSGYPDLVTVHAHVNSCVFGNFKLVGSLVRSLGGSGWFVWRFWTSGSWVSSLAGVGGVFPARFCGF